MPIQVLYDYLEHDCPNPHTLRLTYEDEMPLKNLRNDLAEMEEAGYTVVEIKRVKAEERLEDSYTEWE